MTNSIYSAVLALDSIYQRLYHIETATILLQGIEHGEIEDLENTSVTFTTLASEALSGALTGIFDACEEIQKHLEVVAGKSFMGLRAEAMNDGGDKEAQSTDGNSRIRELISEAKTRAATSGIQKNDTPAIYSCACAMLADDIVKLENRLREVRS